MRNQSLILFILVLSLHLVFYKHFTVFNIYVFVSKVYGCLLLKIIAITFYPQTEPIVFIFLMLVLYLSLHYVLWCEKQHPVDL